MRPTCRILVVATTMTAAASPMNRPAAAQSDPITLPDAVRMALDYHPRLQMARAARDDATSTLAEARSSRIPRAQAEATVTRFQEPMIIAPLHEFDFTTPPQFDAALIQSRFTVGYTLFDGGRRSAGIGRARAIEQSAEAFVASEHMALIEEVTTAYLDVLTADGVDDANRRGVIALEAEMHRTGQLLSEGRAARVELLRAEAALAQAQAERIASSAALEIALKNLARLIGVDAGLVSASRLVSVDPVQRPIEGLLNERAKIANPDVQGARQRAMAAQAVARAARAEWFPTFRLSGGYVTYGGASGNFSAEWQGGVTVSYPLFTGGGRSSRTASAAARAVRAEEEARLAELRIDAAVDRAIAQLRESDGRVTALGLAVDHLSEVARIEQLSLAAGAGVQTDYIAAEANLASARANLVRARHAAIAAHVGLARILGELSAEWLADYLGGGS